MADISGLIVGGIGSIGAVIALIYAHIANHNAKESGRIANDSKGLAVEANNLARQSNTIASGARALAEEANDYRRRTEARETAPRRPLGRRVGPGTARALLAEEARSG